MAPCSPGRGSFLGLSVARFRARATRKPPLSMYTEKQEEGPSSLKKVLTAFDLTFMGIGGIIGAGVFVLTGSAARVEAGPAVVISYMIASFAALLSAFNYAEFAVDLRVAGGAYVYANLVFGELTGWISATSLASEYTLSAAAIARAFTSYAGSLVNGDADFFRISTGSEYILIDIPALLLVFVLCGVLAAGTQTGARFNTIVTIGNLAVITFVLATGLPHLKPANFVPFMPMGVRGTFSGASKVFFSFLGFESVASAAEETRNPPMDLPIGIIAALAVCASLYALMCVTIVGMVPWQQIDIDTPFSSAYRDIGWTWAGKVVAVGAIMGIVTSLMMSLFGQIRLLMCLGRERMLPARVGVVNDKTETPLMATLITALSAGFFALLLDLEALAELVSVGSLVCFLLVNAACVWRRYAWQNVPALSDSTFSGLEDHLKLSTAAGGTYSKVADGGGLTVAMEDTSGISIPKACCVVVPSQLAATDMLQSEGQRLDKPQAFARSNWPLALKMLLLMVTSVTLSGTYVADASDWIVGSLLGCWLLVVLSLYLQPVAWQAAQFRSPCSPFFPCLGILTNVFLIASLGATAYIRFFLWLLVSVAFYMFYSVHNTPVTPTSYSSMHGVELTEQHGASAGGSTGKFPVVMGNRVAGTLPSLGGSGARPRSPHASEVGSLGFDGS